jgi:hypothetical protein
MESEQFLNLTVRRSDAPTWVQRGWRQPSLDDGTVMRLISTAGAGLFLYAAYSARRRRTSKLWPLVCGAGLLAGAAALSRYSLGSRSRQDLASDVVTQESMDSFPQVTRRRRMRTTATPGSL